MAQLTFLPKIDRKATQARLEEVLENVRIYRQFGMIRHEMKVTASSEVRYHGPTNMVGKPAKDIALANVGMSERTYRRNRSSAFYKLAFALRLEVYETEETGGNE
ncbi:penicillin-binding protein [Bacillus toyonensis]|uniref:penicillin-binding protein n=1 Tax=Bacillus toyonensis TaxID=155322 RepID=UPI000BEB7BAE|nr:penicillin-binding protein [Bacillus toyonensis]PDY54687.1 penicillin-binding protein [Bacillus toyonensis]PED18101.1 penicillin-binding protein [Bacillus toyonensis]PEM96623.1 penicillin-binding protein [Bacillus toyonensis]